MGLLGQWLSEDHEFLVWREDLAADYTQWTASTGGPAGHDPELLLRGSALEQARPWLDSQSDLAQLLSLASLHTAPTSEAWASIQTMLSRPVYPFQQLTGHTDVVIGVAFSPDGTLLVTGSFDRTVRLWDVASHRPRGQPLTGHTDWVLGVAFSPDGTLLATTSADQHVQLWDVASHQALDSPLTGHNSAVYQAAFSPDGRLLATTGFDQHVRLWDVANLRPFVAPLTGHTNTVTGVAFSPDGRLLATTSTDGTVRLWAAPATWVDHTCEFVGRNLSQQEWERYLGTASPYVRQCAQYPSGPGANPDAPTASYPESP